MRRHSGIRRKCVACPECGEEFTISWNPQIRRFQAKLYGCPNCGFGGRAGEFDSPSWIMEDDE